MSAERKERERYGLPLSHILLFLLAFLLNQRRDLARDMKATLETVRPRPRVANAHHIPEEGSFVFVANHYERPGLKVWWGGMLAAGAIHERRRSSRTLRWLMTSEWYDFRLAGIVPVPVWFLRWLFRRIAHVYRLVIVPRSPKRRVGRAVAMRSILNVIEGGDPIGMYPEGVGEGVLIEAMPGTGMFLASLSRRGIPILPCGIYEEDSTLIARFGAPFRIELSEDKGKSDRDRQAREQVMSRIGQLLPRDMWGAYTDAIEKAVGRGQTG